MKQINFHIFFSAAEEAAAEAATEEAAAAPAEEEAPAAVEEPADEAPGVVVYNVYVLVDYGPHITSAPLNACQQE